MGNINCCQKPTEDLKIELNSDKEGREKAKEKEAKAKVAIEGGAK